MISSAFNDLPISLGSNKALFFIQSECSAGFGCGTQTQLTVLTSLSKSKYFDGIVPSIVDYMKLSAHGDIQYL